MFISYMFMICVLIDAPFCYFVFAPVLFTNSQIMIIKYVIVDPHIFSQKTVKFVFGYQCVIEHILKKSLRFLYPFIIIFLAYDTVIDSDASSTFVFIISVVAQDLMVCHAGKLC